MNSNDRHSAGALVTVNIRRPGGGIDIQVTDDDLRRCAEDRIAFSATYFGLSIPDYNEWLALDGVALCGGKTQRGGLCKNLVSGFQLDAKEWSARHRRACCKHHAVAGESA